MPWISNDKYKIEEKSTKCSQSSKVISLKLLDWHEFPTLIKILQYIMSLTGPYFSIKLSFHVWDFYYKDKTVMRLSYLDNGNSYIGKVACCQPISNLLYLTWILTWVFQIIWVISRFFTTSGKSIYIRVYQKHSKKMFKLNRCFLSTFSFT